MNSHRFISLDDLSPEGTLALRGCVMRVTCPTCGGRGHFVTEAQPGSVVFVGVTLDGMFITIRVCPDCAGAGEVPGLSAN